VYEFLKAVCISRHCFLKGQEPDIARASKMIIDDFRSGRSGRVTLEFPEEW
jgi:ribosome biogenesis GTPase A